MKLGKGGTVVNTKNNIIPTNKKSEMVTRWVEAGDKAMSRNDYELAVAIYSNAFTVDQIETGKYLIPRISACYRRMSRPKLAIQFYESAVEKYGNQAEDPVVLTAISSAYGDVKKWSEARRCIKRAIELNDGVIDDYISNVIGRIKSNSSGWSVQVEEILFA